jgi:hypothetical protein
MHKAIVSPPPRPLCLPACLPAQVIRSLWGPDATEEDCAGKLRVAYRRLPRGGWVVVWGGVGVPQVLQLLQLCGMPLRRGPRYPPTRRVLNHIAAPCSALLLLLRRGACGVPAPLSHLPGRCGC